MTATVTPVFKETAPEFVAVILAATVGTRLFPLTSPSSSSSSPSATTTTEASLTPKHLLPLAGVPNLIRLIRCIQASGFVRVVLVISQEDTVTIPVLEHEWKQSVGSDNDNSHLTLQQLDLDHPRCHISISRVDAADCLGSAQALRRILLQQEEDHQRQVIPATSNLVVFPGDLVVLNPAVLEQLVHTHRTRSTASSSNLIPAACTILLGDVGEVDEHGFPLKESAKSKKGGLGREEEEIEYIALAYDIDSSSSVVAAPRVVWKQGKVDVEEDKDMVGSTPKFVIPKPRLKTAGITRVRLDWNDWHVYVLSPWVKQLILQRSSLVSLQGDLIPLLVSRQFRGRRKTFGGSYADPLEPVVQQPNESPAVKPTTTTTVATQNNDDSSEYAVLAHVDTTKAVLRAHAVYSYLHATKEFVHQAAAISSSISNSSNRNPSNTTITTTSLWLPPDASLHAKFSTLLQTPTDAKNFKSAVVGRHCTLGAKVRLNNVILMDQVTIGDNVILQNTIVGTGCVIGENCNLNECQVGPGKVVPPGTKEKGESFVDMPG